MSVFYGFVIVVAIVAIGGLVIATLINSCSPGASQSIGVGGGISSVGVHSRGCAGETPFLLGEEEINDILSDEYACVGVSHAPYGGMMSPGDRWNVTLRPDVNNKNDRYAVSVHVDFIDPKDGRAVFGRVGFISARDGRNEDVFDVLRGLSRKEIYARMRLIGGNYSTYGLIDDLMTPSGVEYGEQYMDDFSETAMQHIPEKTSPPRRRSRTTQRHRTTEI